MRRGQVLVRAIKVEGKWGNVDVLDLDDESFRAFVLDKLCSAGLVTALADGQSDEEVTLKEHEKDEPSLREFEALSMAQREELLGTAMTRQIRWHIYMETLSKAQRDVAALRLEIGAMWPDPDVMDSYVFLVSEIGEVGDALLRSNFGHRGDYSRNNTKYVDVAAELGDVYLMLCTLATALGVDLDAALQGCIDKLRRKYGHANAVNKA